MRNDLYVFSHIPKTAGFFFRHNIQLSHDPHFLVTTTFLLEDKLKNQQTKKLDHFYAKEHFLAQTQSLSEAQKHQVQCVAGHDAYYGIHSVFDDNAKYFTFIREPVARTLSMYNYVRHRWNVFLNRKNNVIEQPGFKNLVLDDFLINGEVPDFETWLNNIYDQKHHFCSTQTNFLQYMNFIDNKRHEASIREALKKFYFIGITELFNTDAAYLYHLLGVTSSMGIKNISPRFANKQDLSTSLIQRIQELNEDDMLLYECALRENADFKKNTKDFYVKVAKSDRLRRLHYPIDRLKEALKDILRPIVKPVLTSLNLRK